MKIKYDLRSLKFTKILAIVSLVLFILGLAASCFDALMENAETWMLGTVIFCIEGAGFIMILCWGSYFRGRCYIKRLKAYGYEVPYKKSDYGCDVRNLPKIGEPEGVSIGSKYSKVFMIISLIMYVVLLALDGYYFAKWRPLIKDSADALYFMLMTFHLFWPIYAFILNKQSDKDKYRDDVEQDFSRKPRWSLEGLILAVVIMGLASLYSNLMAHTMTEYIYKTRLVEQQEQLETNEQYN